MRKLFSLLFIIIFIADSSFAQIDADIYSIDVNDYYQDVANRVLYTKVIASDSLSQKEIIQLVKNWAAINFRNLRYTLVGETENQLVVRYIQEGFYTNALIKTSALWNILLIVQVKDGKLRYQFTDEGNAYSSPGLFAAKVTNDREYYLSSFSIAKKSLGMQLVK